MRNRFDFIPINLSQFKHFINQRKSHHNFCMQPTDAKFFQFMFLWLKSVDKHVTCYNFKYHFYLNKKTIKISSDDIFVLGSNICVRGERFTLDTSSNPKLAHKRRKLRVIIYDSSILCYNRWTVLQTVLITFLEITDVKTIICFVNRN